MEAHHGFASPPRPCTAELPLAPCPQRTRRDLPGATEAKAQRASKASGARAVPPPASERASDPACVVQRSVHARRHARSTGQHVQGHELAESSLWPLLPSRAARTSGLHATRALAVPLRRSESLLHGVRPRPREPDSGTTHVRPAGDEAPPCP